MRDVWEAMLDKTRREILAMLQTGDMSAGEIADRFRLTKATVSHHLSVLKAAGLITAAKYAQTVVYSLDKAALRAFLRSVNELFAGQDFMGECGAAGGELPFCALRGGERAGRLDQNGIIRPEPLPRDKEPKATTVRRKKNASGGSRTNLRRAFAENLRRAAAGLSERQKII